GRINAASEIVPLERRDRIEHPAVVQGCVKCVVARTAVAPAGRVITLEAGRIKPSAKGREIVGAFQRPVGSTLVLASVARTRAYVHRAGNALPRQALDVAERGKVRRPWIAWAAARGLERKCDGLIQHAGNERNLAGGEVIAPLQTLQLHVMLLSVESRIVHHRLARQLAEILPLDDDPAVGF